MTVSSGASAASASAVLAAAPFIAPGRRREFCHSAAPPSAFGRRLDRDGEGGVSKMTVSRRRLIAPDSAGRERADLKPSARVLSLCRHSFIVPIETPAGGRGECRRMAAASPAAASRPGRDQIGRLDGEDLQRAGEADAEPALGGVEPQHPPGVAVVLGCLRPVRARECGAVVSS